jgi:hypothetical protein
MYLYERNEEEAGGKEKYVFLLFFTFTFYNSHAFPFVRHRRENIFCSQEVLVFCTRHATLSSLVYFFQQLYLFFYRHSIILPWAWCITLEEQQLYAEEFRQAVT